MGDTLPPPGGGMPWKECHVMDERCRFVARLLDGEKMTPLCAEFGISRKTGYKIFDRYKDDGLTTQERFAFTAFDRAFTEFGLPSVIRTDNGVPFAAPT